MANPRRAIAALLGIASAAAVLTAAPVGAQNVSSGQLTAGSEAEPAAPACDVELDVKLVNLDHTHANGKHVDHRTSGVITLDQPIPAGRVLTSGITTDLDHLEDEIDFTTEKSQFEEQVRVRFLNADGQTIGTTDPTPDLPDVAPEASFALPSIDLAESAVAIEIVHAANGNGPNSVGVPCMNFKTVGPDSGAGDYVQHASCWGDGLAPPPPDATCGYLAVPENRKVAGSRLINIAFAIFPGDGSKPDPLVYLEGGPGGAPIWVSSLIHDLAMGPVAGDRDVIYVDQRGTGYSYPNLNCPGEEAVTSEEEFFEFVSQCGKDFQASNVDLNGYTTVQNGHDVADLRIALGLEEWNLFGGSYGTDLGLTIMRDRPEGVRSVVLDSVFPPEVNPVAGDQGIGFLKELDALVARCAADPACGPAFPDIRQNIIDAVDNLNHTPVPVTGTEAEFLFGTPELLVDGVFLLDFLRTPGLDLPALPLGPALLNGLANSDPAVREAAIGNFFRSEVFRLLGLPPEIANELKVAYYGIPGIGTQFSGGFNSAVICAEEFPFSEAATSYSGPGWSPAIEDYASAALELYRITCEDWGVEPEDSIVTQPVVSDIETLVLYTDRDYQTVPEWSELAASRLTNAQLVFFPNLGHVVTFYDPCPQYVVSQFLDRPGGLVDTGCVADLPIISYEGELPAIPPLPPIEEFFEQLDELLGPPPGEGPPEEEGTPPEDAADEGSEAAVVAGPALSSGSPGGR